MNDANIAQCTCYLLSLNVMADSRKSNSKRARRRKGPSGALQKVHTDSKKRQTCRNA